MLPKASRLKKKKEIERVLKRGKGFKEGFLILKSLKNGLRNSRFAFVVSRKVSKKATLRNKIRRRLSELMRLKIKKIKKGLDLVLLASPGMEKGDLWEIKENIDRLFARAKIYNHGTDY